MKYVWTEDDVLAGREFSIEDDLYMIIENPPILNSERLFKVLLKDGYKPKEQIAEWLTNNCAIPCHKIAPMKVLFTEDDIQPGLTVCMTNPERNFIIIRNGSLGYFSLLCKDEFMIYISFDNQKQMAKYLNDNDYQLAKG